MEKLIRVWKLEDTVGSNLKVRPTHLSLSLSLSLKHTHTHESIPNFVKLCAHIKNQPRATLRACVTPPKAAESKKFKLSNY